MSAAFTPGPWKPEGFSVRSSARAIALVHPDTSVSPNDSLGIVDANARLIAAAPDMFNVLTLLLATEPDDAAGMADVHADAKAALAKARGEQVPV
jgi:hypothetical protein